MSLPIATESSTVMPDLNDEMDVENERGQGASRIAGHPKVQENSPHDLEGRVPNSEHSTGHESDQCTNRTYTKDGDKAPIVSKKPQEKLPESVERAVPNAIDNTDDTSGLHRKQ